MRLYSESESLYAEKWKCQIRVKCRLNQPDNTNSYCTWCCLSLCVMKELLTWAFLMFWVVHQNPLSPRQAQHLKVTFSGTCLFLSLSLSLFFFLLSFFLSFSLSLWVSQSGHPAHDNQMAKDAPQLSVSLSLLCTAHDLLRGGTVCTPCVCVCMYMCSLPLPCLLRHKHPLIKAVIFLPSDDTLAHVREVGAGAEESEGHQAVLRKTCACVYLRARPCVSSACNQQLRIEHQRLSVRVGVLSDDDSTLFSLRGQLELWKISRNDRKMDGLENRQPELQSLESSSDLWLYDHHLPSDILSVWQWRD